MSYEISMIVYGLKLLKCSLLFVSIWYWYPMELLSCFQGKKHVTPFLKNWSYLFFYLSLELFKHYFNVKLRIFTVTFTPFNIFWLHFVFIIFLVFRNKSWQKLSCIYLMSPVWNGLVLSLLVKIIYLIWSCSKKFSNNYISLNRTLNISFFIAY